MRFCGSLKSFSFYFFQKNNGYTLKRSKCNFFLDKYLENKSFKKFEKFGLNSILVIVYKKSQ